MAREGFPDVEPVGFTIEADGAASFLARPVFAGKSVSSMSTIGSGSLRTTERQARRNLKRMHREWERRQVSVTRTVMVYAPPRPPVGPSSYSGASR